MGDLEKVKNEALEIIGQFENLPRLVVFDLDYTLWPFYCECCYEDEIPYLYPHAKGILEALKEKGINVAIASRSPAPDIARTFLHKLGIQSMFVSAAKSAIKLLSHIQYAFFGPTLFEGMQEIFSSWSHKTDHFRRIHRETGVPFSSILFFDDENRNIEAVSVMGVTSILVDNGISLNALRQGFSEFSQKSGSLS